MAEQAAVLKASLAKATSTVAGISAIGSCNHLMASWGKHAIFDSCLSMDSSLFWESLVKRSATLTSAAMTTTSQFAVDRDDLLFHLIRAI